jgi:hypothetical protein
LTLAAGDCALDSGAAGALMEFCGGGAVSVLCFCEAQENAPIEMTTAASHKRFIAAPSREISP